MRVATGCGTSRAGLVASALAAPLLDGPRRPLRVVHSGPLAHHLALDDEHPKDRVVVCVTFPGAIRLPHAVVVPAPPGSPPPLSVGGGQLHWSGSAMRVSRWWTPQRVTRSVGAVQQADAGQPSRLSPLVRSDPPGRSDRIGPTGLTGRIARDAASGRLRRTLDRMIAEIGSGPGLTPYADDVVCGAFIALRQVAPTLDLAALLPADLDRRTTGASACLLRLAAGGWCIDELADYLHRPTDESRSALASIGHTSGAGLIEGVDAIRDAEAA